MLFGIRWSQGWNQPDILLELTFRILDLRIPRALLMTCSHASLERAHESRTTHMSLDEMDALVKRTIDEHPNQVVSCILADVKAFMKSSIVSRDGGTVPVARQMAPCLAPRRHRAILCRSWPWHAGHHVTGLYLFRTSDMN